MIAAWNYPIHLTFAPLVGVLAAGNTAVLKPSESAPASSSLIAELVPRYLDERVVQVVEGGVDETTAVLAEQFDHIIYTGGASVARIVMGAAAAHLTPVTLELGGKSPAIVAADADIEVAARRITWGRFTNAGQTCVAPDYVLVARAVEDRFLGAVLRSVHDFYGENPKTSADYGRIINDRHFDRLTRLLDAGGYEAVVTGGSGDRGSRYFAPTVLAGVSPDAAVMAEEIFGPILPVITVANVDEAVSFVNDRPHPLALYVFTEDPPLPNGSSNAHGRVACRSITRWSISVSPICPSAVSAPAASGRTTGRPASTGSRTGGQCWRRPPSRTRASPTRRTNAGRKRSSAGCCDTR